MIQLRRSEACDTAFVHGEWKTRIWIYRTPATMDQLHFQNKPHDNGPTTTTAACIPLAPWGPSAVSRTPWELDNAARPHGTPADPLPPIRGSRTETKLIA